jgi:predicted nucleic acid-binding protein
VTIVVDTTIIVDVLREREEARAALLSAHRRGDRVAASALTRVEVLAGMLPHEEPPIRRLFAQLEWVDVDEEVAERAGELARAYMRSHRGIDVVDYVVAATAQLRGARLWTLNRKHFPMFDSLPDPYAA